MNDFQKFKKVFEMEKSVPWIALPAFYVAGIVFYISVFPTVVLRLFRDNTLLSIPDLFSLSLEKRLRDKESGFD